MDILAAVFFLIIGATFPYYRPLVDRYIARRDLIASKAEAFDALMERSAYTQVEVDHIIKKLASDRPPFNLIDLNKNQA